MLVVVLSAVVQVTLVSLLLLLLPLMVLLALVQISISRKLVAWGTITHFGIFDALTTGNLLVHGALTTSKTIDTGDVFKIASGSLTVTFA